MLGYLTTSLSMYQARSSLPTSILCACSSFTHVIEWERGSTLLNENVLYPYIPSVVNIFYQHVCCQYYFIEPRVDVFQAVIDESLSPSVVYDAEIKRSRIGISSQLKRLLR